jgi:uncharacterized DUF497 family protein
VFEWDPRKAQSNADKHGVTFDEAVTVLLDTNALDGPDRRHSAAEGRVLMVSYTVRSSNDGETVRLISARRASRRERSAYAPKD